MPHNRFRADIERIKAAVAGRSIADALGLPGRGKRFFCPRCQPRGGKTPDLSVGDQGFHCFKCGASGDVIELIKLAHGVGFHTAVGWLAAEMGQKPPGGIRGRDNANRTAHTASSHQRQFVALANVPRSESEARRNLSQCGVLAAFLANCRSVEGAALDFLTVRGIAAEVVNGLEIRFCGREYAELMRSLESEFGREGFLQAGLFSRGRRGPYPTFWPYYATKVGFLVIPYLRDGRPVYLKARPPIDQTTTEGMRIPRFLNTAGAVPCPYNVDTLLTAGRVLICEGETDTMTALTRGYPAVGVPGWTHFKAEWVQLFQGKKVFLTLDADAAGDKGVRDIARKFERAGLPLPREVVLPRGQDLSSFFSVPTGSNL